MARKHLTKTPEKRKQRLVFVTPWLPDATGTGSEQRAYAFLLAYSRIMDVELWFSVRQTSADIRRISKIAHLCVAAKFFHVELLRANIDKLHDRFAAALAAADHVHLFKLPFGITHKSILWDFDELPPALRTTAQGKDASGKDLPEAAIKEGDAFTGFAKSCTVIFSASPLETHPSLGTVRTVNNCYQTVETLRRKASGSKTLLFVGTMSYGPNILAVRHFASSIMPHLPDDFRLRIVGRRPLAGWHLTAMDELGNTSGVELFYDVESCTPHYAEASIAVVPLLQGSGTRIKILEAFAHKCPVISTTKGAEGLQVTHGTDILLVDEPKAFAAAILKLHRDNALRTSLVKQAGRTLANHYSQVRIEQQLYDALLTGNIITHSELPSDHVSPLSRTRAGKLSKT